MDFCRWRKANQMYKVILKYPKWKLTACFKKCVINLNILFCVCLNLPSINLREAGEHILMKWSCDKINFDDFEVIEILYLNLQFYFKNTVFLANMDLCAQCVKRNLFFLDAAIVLTTFTPSAIFVLESKD